VQNARKVFFPLERVPELLEETGRLCVHVRDFLHWLSYSGMRPKAIRRLRWTDLDAEDWVLTLSSDEDKNRFGRELALAGEGRKIIEGRSRDFSELIFGHPPVGCTFGRGGRRLRELTERHLREVWTLALREMDLPSGEEGFRPYDLKKTALRAIRRAGVPEERAMHFSGHKTASTFRRYDIVAREDNREDAERVSAYRKKRFSGGGGKLLRLGKRAG
jgi:integrase